QRLGAEAAEQRPVVELAGPRAVEARQQVASGPQREERGVADLVEDQVVVGHEREPERSRVLGDDEPRHGRREAKRRPPCASGGPRDRGTLRSHGGSISSATRLLRTGPTPRKKGPPSSWPPCFASSSARVLRETCPTRLAAGRYVDQRLGSSNLNCGFNCR